jgi:hypothetical protein
VTVYATTEQARATFRETFEAALADAGFAARLKEGELSLHFLYTDGFALFLGPDGVTDEAPYAPALRFELAADTAHELFLGLLPVTRAVVLRRLTVKGPVARVRVLAELLPVLGREYARLAPRPQAAA